MAPVTEVVLQLMPAVAAFATEAASSQPSILSASAGLPPEAIFEKPDSYIEPQAPGPDLGSHEFIRAPMLFAPEGSSQPPASGAPPSGVGSGNGGDDHVGKGFFIGSLVGMKFHDMIRAIKGMSGAETLELTILSDMAKIQSAPEKLVYMSDIAKAMSGYVRSGNEMGWGESVSALQIIVGAADSLTDYVTPSGIDGEPLIGDKPAIYLSKDLMRPILSATDHVERFLIASDGLNRDLAFKLASIYQVTAMKGAIYEAERERSEKGQSSLNYQAYVGRTILQLRDVQERFEGIDRMDIAEGVKDALLRFISHHGAVGKNYESRALETVTTFLGSNIDNMYNSVSVDPDLQGPERTAAIENIRSERYSRFLTNVRYMIDGNRSYARTIIFRCMKAFQGHKDTKQGRTFREWFISEQNLTTRMMEQGFMKGKFGRI